MIYFTSDLHFGHNKDFLYQPRGFVSIEQHDIIVVGNWNSRITDEDIVYILGDIVMNDKDSGIEKFCSLKGQKKIIYGNHDTDAKIDAYAECPNTELLGYASVVKSGKRRFYISHYPTIVSNMDANRPICLHGHTHSKDKFQYAEFGCYNVALDAHRCFPISIEEIISDLKERRNGI